ncbi:DUF2752 domain-containing protein [Chitinophagaceae bacterium MMS25-I14]
MAAYAHIVDWLGHHLLSCPFKRLTGLDCPGCGMQRSVIALLRGDFSASWHMYPAGIVLIIAALFLPLHLKFQFRYGALFIKILSFAAGILIIGNYIHKIITQQLI